MPKPNKTECYVEMGTFFISEGEAPSIAYLKRGEEVIAMFGAKYREEALRCCDLFNAKP